MKRSQLNTIISDAITFIQEHNFKLPPFAYFSPEDWKTKGSEYTELIDTMLGWDITDFGSGDFKNTGLLMFTIRNGSLKNDKYIKTYAEKLLIAEEHQVTPFHFHWQKMEDIINRGNHVLKVQLYNSHPDDEGKFDTTDVLISMDGRNHYVPAGSIVDVNPGESITLHTYTYHKFWPEGGKLLIGEVSRVNDDNIDNRFYEDIGRFPKIVEDAPKKYYLFNEIKLG